MDWYSFEVENLDENGEMQKRTEYRFHDMRLTNREMREMGYTERLGKVHFSEDTYFGLEGETTNTSNYTATINAMTEDFGKMGTSDARQNISKAESYLSGIGWNAGLPTMIGLGTSLFVVPFSTNSYTNVTDRSLKREFDAKYQSQIKTIGRYMSPVDNSFNVLGGLVTTLATPLPLAPFTPSSQEIMDRVKTNHNSTLLGYYTKYNIIRR